jgi:hypothetical protein
VKYRVNLYRERGERAGRFRRGLYRGSVVGVVVGVEILLIGLLLVSGFQLRERSAEAQRLIQAMKKQTAAGGELPGAQAGRAILRERVARVDWATTLAHVAAAVPDRLVLSEIEGEARPGGGRQEMSVKGKLAHGGDLGPVFEFLSALRADSVLVTTFPSIDLGTAHGEGEQTFIVLFRKEAAKEEEKRK